MANPIERYFIISILTTIICFTLLGVYGGRGQRGRRVDRGVYKELNETGKKKVVTVAGILLIG
jgi:hypothetical protein